MTTTQTHTADGRPRARGLGIALPGQPGTLNAITDVGGVEVGVTTLISGDAVRTGVTSPTTGSWSCWPQGHNRENRR